MLSNSNKKVTSVERKNHVEMIDFSTKNLFMLHHIIKRSVYAGNVPSVTDIVHVCNVQLLSLKYPGPKTAESQSHELSLQEWRRVSGFCTFGHPGPSPFLAVGKASNLWRYFPTLSQRYFLAPPSLPLQMLLLLTQCIALEWVV